MKDFISPGYSIGEYWIRPVFCVAGVALDMPESFYSCELSGYQLNSWSDVEEDINSFARPLLSSFYCHSSHFTGDSSGFEGELEEFWDSTMKTIADIREDFKCQDREEFIENYDTETAEAIEWLGDTEVGVTYDTEVKQGSLYIHMSFGDCSVYGNSNDNTSDSPGLFSKEELPTFAWTYTGSYEALDRGEVPDELTDTEELTDTVLVYSLGVYLFRQLVPDTYTDNKTETLYNTITSGVDTEDLVWCELEGKEVTDKWVQLVDSLS